MFSAGVVAPDWIANSTEEEESKEERVVEEDTKIGYCKTHNNFSYLSEIQILVFSVSLIALLFISLLSILSKLKFLIVWSQLHKLYLNIIYTIPKQRKTFKIFLFFPIEKFLKDKFQYLCKVYISWIQKPKVKFDTHTPTFTNHSF